MLRAAMHNDSAGLIASSASKAPGFGLFGMGLVGRLALSLTAASILAVAAWWALSG
jgi:hypothetical protein